MHFVPKRHFLSSREHFMDTWTAQELSYYIHIIILMSFIGYCTKWLLTFFKFVTVYQTYFIRQQYYCAYHILSKFGLQMLDFNLNWI